MSQSRGRGALGRRQRTTMLRRVGILVWKVLRALLLAGAAMGPSVPPPPPPPPQTIAVKAENDAAEPED